MVSNKNDLHVSDEVLVQRTRAAKDADLRAFDILVQRYQAEVLANCRFITNAADDAEDLAQEVFLRAYHGLARFEERASFRTWLQRIKVNHCLNYLRKKRGRTFVDIEDPGLAVEPALRATSKQPGENFLRDEAIKQALTAMPDTLRVPLVLADVDELPYAEISELLGLGLSATKMRIRRARGELRQRLAARGFGLSLPEFEIATKVGDGS